MGRGHSGLAVLLQANAAVAGSRGVLQAPGDVERRRCQRQGFAIGLAPREGHIGAQHVDVGAMDVYVDGVRVGDGLATAQPAAGSMALAEGGPGTSGREGCS